MPNYRRAFAPGGTFFFTVVTYARCPLFDDPGNRRLLHEAFDFCRGQFAFTIDAFVLLPDHLHTLWTLPDDDPNFSIRWAIIKKRFTQTYLDAGGISLPVSVSKSRSRRRGLWQRRFWEHLVRDELDYARHLDYIYYNPVKHGLSVCPHAWPYSTFSRDVGRGMYTADWGCSCKEQIALPPFDDLAVDYIE